MVLARRRRWERGPPETVLPAATQEHGTWAPENSVTAEKCQEAGRNEEVQGSRSEDGSQGGASVHLQRLQVPDARPKNLQAALREQTPQIPAAPRVRGSGGINYLDVPH